MMNIRLNGRAGIWIEGSLFGTKLLCYGWAFVVSLTCAFGNSIQQKNRHEDSKALSRKSWYNFAPWRLGGKCSVLYK